MARLVCIRGEHEGKSFPIDKGLTVGRAPHSGIALPGTRGVSRDHAKVWKTGDRRYDVADLGSTNGTLVNDERKDRSALEDGDSIQIGEAIFRFEWDEAEKPAAQSSAPAARTGAAGRVDAASLFGGAAGTPADAGASAAPPGQPTIKVTERVLQYSKKKDGGTVFAWDLSQMGGLMKWILVAAVLGAFALIFVLVRGAA